MNRNIFLLTIYVALIGLGVHMNNTKYIIEGNWDEIKGKIQKYWGKLTEDNIKEINGSYDTLIGKLKEVYGYSENEVEKEIAAFFNSSDFEKLKKQAKDKIDEIKMII